MADPSSRTILKRALIARYFPSHRESFFNLFSSKPDNTYSAIKLNDLDQPKLSRNAAFRKTIREIYDYRCAACGIRLILQEGPKKVLIEAAHLIPWEAGQNDHPSNGMALCRNDHWALDEHLIAPCPSKEHQAGVWKVSPVLDSRIADQQAFIRLDAKHVISPTEWKFLPDQEALQWREKRLLGA